MNFILIVTAETVVIFCLGLVIYNLIKSKKKIKAENDNLLAENTRLRKDIVNYEEARKETIENQKKYRNNDDVSNFNASIDFLRNCATNNNQSSS